MERRTYVARTTYITVLYYRITSNDVRASTSQHAAAGLTNFSSRVATEVRLLLRKTTCNSLA